MGLALIKYPIWQNLSFYQLFLFIQRSQNMDTLNISKTLQAAGFERKQAEAVAKIINERN
ncbi:hypothetical protein SPONN_340 [uncultured Candidatus Thioglobus sp.]|nr:hypothetical protein SPONL_1662 [uncultured Candidatus Thioglobus sp.]SMN02011.1 hypothetical protein SPONN_340 [uncultured Candidatus Thioglobus sp.]